MEEVDPSSRSDPFVATLWSPVPGVAQSLPGDVLKLTGDPRLLLELGLRRSRPGAGFFGVLVFLLGPDVNGTDILYLSLKAPPLSRCRACFFCRY